MRGTFEMEDLSSSEQWLLAEAVTEILMEIKELEVEVSYAIGELRVPGGEPGLCIIARTMCGSVSFIEDRSAQVWLERLNHHGIAEAELLKLVVDDAPDRLARRLAKLCITTLMYEQEICAARLSLH